MSWNWLLALFDVKILDKNTIVFKKPLGRSISFCLDQATCVLSFWVTQCRNKAEVDGKD